jgi:hypothetical protein
MDSIVERRDMNTISSILNFIANHFGITEVSASNVSSLPITISNANILEKHVCVKAVLSNPSARASVWEVTTSAGSAVITGSISGTTDITLYLALKVK